MHFCRHRGSLSKKTARRQRDSGAKPGPKEFRKNYMSAKASHRLQWYHYSSSDWLDDLAFLALKAFRFFATSTAMRTDRKVHSPTSHKNATRTAYRADGKNLSMRTPTVEKSRRIPTYKLTSRMMKLGVDSVQRISYLGFSQIAGSPKSTERGLGRQKEPSRCSRRQSSNR